MIKSGQRLPTRYRVTVPQCAVRAAGVNRSPTRRAGAARLARGAVAVEMRTSGSRQAGRLWGGGKQCGLATNCVPERKGACVGSVARVRGPPPINGVTNTIEPFEIRAYVPTARGVGCGSTRGR